jgi:hypothetical protein
LGIGSVPGRPQTFTEIDGVVDLCARVRKACLDKASNLNTDSTEGKHGKCTAGKFHRLERQQKAEKN